MKEQKSLHCLAQALDFLSQDINEEMTHTCKKKRKKEREEEKKREGVRDVGFRGMRAGD